MPIGTAKGFGVTFRQIFRKPITQQYPAVSYTHLTLPTN